MQQIFHKNKLFEGHRPEYSLLLLSLGHVLHRNVVITFFVHLKIIGINKN